MKSILTATALLLLIAGASAGLVQSLLPCLVLYCCQSSFLADTHPAHLLSDTHGAPVTCMLQPAKVPRATGAGSPEVVAAPFGMVAAC